MMAALKVSLPNICVISLPPANFVWVAAVMGEPNTSTSLTSPTIAIEYDVCFNFWFDMSVGFSSLIQTITISQYDLGIGSLRIVINSDSDNIEVTN